VSSADPAIVRAVTDAVAVDPLGVALPPDARSVAAPLVTDGRDPSTVRRDAALWLLDDQGAVVRVPASGGDLPAPAGAWRVAGLDLTATSLESWDGFWADVDEVPSVSVGVTELRVGTPAGETSVPFDGDWELALVGDVDTELFDLDDLTGAGTLPGSGTPVVAQQSAGAVTMRVGLGTEVRARLVPSGAADPVPVLANDGFVARFDGEVGDTPTLGFAGTGRALAVEVRAIAAVVPGASEPVAYAADLPAVQRQLLATSDVVPQPDAVWIAADDPAGVAAAVAEVTGGTPVVSTAERPLVAPARDALRLGAAGAALLAVLAVAAAVAARDAGTAREVVALRVLGFAARQQARVRGIEFGTAIGLGLLVGMVGGLGVALLTVPGSVRAALVGAIQQVPIAFAVSPVDLALAVAGIALASGVVVAVGAAAVARIAARVAPREEGA
jgi:hypothetical protein